MLHNARLRYADSNPVWILTNPSNLGLPTTSLASPLTPFLAWKVLMESSARPQWKTVTILGGQRRTAAAMATPVMPIRMEMMEKSRRGEVEEEVVVVERWWRGFLVLE